VTCRLIALLGDEELKDKLVIVEIIHFDIVGIIGLKKSKSTHWKSSYWRRSPLSTPYSKDEYSSCTSILYKRILYPSLDARHLWHHLWIKTIVNIAIRVGLKLLGYAYKYSCNGLQGL